MNFTYSISSAILSFFILTASIFSPSPMRQGTADQLLEAMTAEEKVGQLFLVSIPVDQLGSEGYVYGLLQNYHIGGVLVSPSENLVGEISSADLQLAINDLQTYRMDMSDRPSIDSEDTGEIGAPVYVPLFIATSMSDQSLLMDRVVGQAAPIPSPMAVGATWDPENAYAIGSLAGEQLASLGINMVFSPVLDVLDQPGAGSQNGIGVSSFGGDPYWVGVMGERYIEGLHDGSDRRVSVISSHFPGLGSSDRPMELEVATIRKSLEQLKQIELAPFFTVTDGAPGDAGVTDGLLTAHIRYQGFQGNIRATTKPVSLDSSALSQILALEPFHSWGLNGGIVVSDSLGFTSIKRFIESTGRVYNGYLVARDAFLAGNDMMVLSDLSTSEEKTEYDTVAEVLSFFAQKYREDNVFAQQVDNSVLKILNSKLRLYGGSFNPSDIQISPSALNEISYSEDVGVNIARRAVTLVSPLDVNEIEERTGGAPEYGSRVVIFSDTRQTVPCLSCSPEPGISLHAFEEAVGRLYGPSGAGLVSGWQFESFTMEDLAAYLGTPIPADFTSQITPSEMIDDSLREADWLLFIVQDRSTQYYGSSALTEFLDQRSDLIRENIVVVFSTGTPFNLDATDFSKIDVYFSLYSATLPFIEAAARVLFLEMTPSGASPVSVPGIGYDLINATAPDPTLQIPLSGRFSGNAIDSSVVADVQIGDLIELFAGPILDTNGNIVPDKTPVDFILSYQGESTAQVRVSSSINSGIAQTVVTIERSGILTVRIESSDAILSEVLTFNIPAPVSANGQVSETALVPTDEILPTENVADLQATPTDDVPAGRSGILGLSGLVLGLLGASISIGVFLIAAAGMGLRHDEKLRSMLLIFSASLIGYNFLSLKLPGSGQIVQMMGSVSSVILPAGAGLLVGFVVIGSNRLKLQKRRQHGDEEEKTGSSN